MGAMITTNQELPERSDMGLYGLYTESCLLTFFYWVISFI